MKSEERKTRSRSAESVETPFLLTRSVIKLLVGKPWRALLSGVWAAVAMVFLMEVFLSVVVVLFAVFIAADICNHFTNR